MKVEDPYQGKAQITESPSQLSIRVNSRLNLGLTLFMSFWMCGWVVGEVAALSALFSSTAGWHSLFLIGWLGAWTVGGLLIFAQILWNVAGYELLQVSEGKLVLGRYLPLFRREMTYDLSHVSNIRVSGVLDQNPLVMQQMSKISVFGSRSMGILRFDYGMQTPGFGLHLSEAEARLIATKLQARLEGE